MITGRVDYKLNWTPTLEALKKIDTSAYYVQVFEGRYYNETEKEYRIVLKFHGDGFYRSGLADNFNSKDLRHPKNTTGCGGKYLIEDNEIKLERFLPMRGGKTNYYSRDYKKGRIENNKLIFDEDNSALILEKRFELNN
ncbi:hypothetical protein MG296_14410 [Flavobacteriaceae bacterium TK19130]|nr:hypothetical protein [Thermobacterium salinum]